MIIISCKQSCTCSVYRLVPNLRCLWVSVCIKPRYNERFTHFNSAWLCQLSIIDKFLFVYLWSCFSCSIVWLVAGLFFFHSNKWKHLVAYVKRTSWIHNICSPSKYILKQKIKKIWCWFDKLDFSEMMPFTHPTSHSCKTLDSYFVHYLYFVCQLDERIFKM